MEQAVEKVCPECGGTLRAGERACPHCGQRFAAGAPRRRAVRAVLLVWAAASAALMVVGALGPWLNLLLAKSISGIDDGQGWRVIAAAAIGATLMTVRRTTRRAGAAAVVAGGIGAAVTIHERTDLTRAIGAGGSLTAALLQIGWGLDLALGASLSFGLAGLVWLLVMPSAEPRGEAADEPSGAATASRA